MQNSLSRQSLRKALGLTDNMSTYFLRAPQEYWQALGKKPQPYDDNVGEYEFIHAFFADLEEMSNYSDILVSKLAVNGILWVSWPILSTKSDTLESITPQQVCQVYSDHGLKNTGDCAVADKWHALKFTF